MLPFAIFSMYSTARFSNPGSTFTSFQPGTIGPAMLKASLPTGAASEGTPTVRSFSMKQYGG